MNLTLIKEDQVTVSTLPEEVTGKHWLQDLDAAGKTRRLASIDARDEGWSLAPYGSFTLFDTHGTQVERLTLAPREGLYTLRAADGSQAVLLVEFPAEPDKQYSKLGFKDALDITIGRSEDNLFWFANEYVSLDHAILRYFNESFSIIDNNSANGVFVNYRAIPCNVSMPLMLGDVVFIMGLKIMVGQRFIAFNNPGGNLRVNPHPAQVHYTPQPVPQLVQPLLEDEAVDYFYRSPRIKRDIECKNFDVEDPPQQEKADESPAILKIGPSLGMALGSALMGLYMVSNMMSGQQGASMRAVPMLGMVVVMILGAVLWPNLSKRYERRKRERNESKRKATYAAYLDKIRESFIQECALQKEILEENRLSVEDCVNRVFTQDRRLFERTGIQSDFLELRVGRGDVPLDAQIKFPSDKLSLDEDMLKSLVRGLASKPQIVEDVPLSLPLITNYVSGVVGGTEQLYPFIRNLIVQITALHAPDEVKIVFIGDEAQSEEWGFIRALPHIFDDTFGTRFLATTREEAMELSLRLERELHQRQEANKNLDHPSDYGIYYVVIVASKELATTTEAIDSLVELRQNKGFSVLTLGNSIRDLPKECSCIIELDAGGQGQVYNPKDASGKRLTFTVDAGIANTEAKRFSDALALIPLDVASARSDLPKSLGFLEMFEAGKVEHLNIKSRWNDNNPCLSLHTPVGVDPNGELSLLNIHEDFHGPHGLVAGMTGSGKSEFIITYILSLAVNYRPDEVSFVLIDYKGGGLAGAFDNDKARLPHLAGTITNLDGAAINRSLVSIQSELKRRQAVFNTARDKAGLGTMDIYKYQELYRQGVVDDPIPHMLIISDEFAELKAQQPEFMDQLISAARIGRSLGVHLILATQKPSGVVNDQIWSNARFKVCLKVADAADSREMLKRPDAAELVDAGRFYVQVGFNEYFALGQSAYAGATYRPVEHFERKKDNAVTLISNTGRPMASAKPEAPQVFGATKAPESVAVLSHIVEVAAAQGLEAPRLWLDPIAQHVTIDELDEKYPREKEPFALNPALGEYDDPYNQKQSLLTLPLSREGNAIIYGATGSGKATLVGSMLYSLIKEHTAKTLNAYILDFGAETLGAFRAAPQVGDVVFASDEEKIENLFRMLASEIERRKKLLSAFGGSFERYNEQAGESPLPNILVILNNYDIFPELYERFADNLLALTRDGMRYHISFVLTCSRATSVGYRLLPNFKQKLVLRLNSKDEYLTILGSLQDTVPPALYARGLIRLDRIYEFQGACIAADEDEYAATREKVAQLTGPSQQTGAQEIPTLPEAVTTQTFANRGLPKTALPLGIAKEDISVVTHDFAKSSVMLVLSENEDNQVPFLEGILGTLALDRARTAIVLDVDGFLKDKHIEGVDYYHGKPAVAEFVREWVEPTEQADPVGQPAKPDSPASADTFIVGISVRSLVEALAPDLRKRFEAQFVSGTYRKNAGLILTGEPARFAPFNFEPWFKEITSYGNGVWVGDGISNQSALKVGRALPSFRNPVPKGFGYYVYKNNASYVKLVGPAGED
ncbi:MAG: type VII secretion protein EssC [Coriobacteriales bacterium]|jgi:S-DNA-T family DNA segregation ATPase FtsK/SpoIIIE|nr:type VII secretion protein EssC [Coriobacteriales bacterium]